MMRAIVLFVVSFLLTSCTGTKFLELPTLRERAMDPRICATPPAEPELPASAGLVNPVTVEEADAVSGYVTWSERHAAWGQRGWELVAIARRRCPEVPAPED